MFPADTTKIFENAEMGNLKMGREQLMQRYKNFLRESSTAVARTLLGH